MSSLTAVSRIALAKLVFDQPLHFAWGAGDGSWTTLVPAVTGTETALIAEVGRRVATFVSYVTPDSAGEIVVNNGAFSISAVPSRHFYVRTDFDYFEATGASIREAALFVGTKTAVGLSPTQKYFTPAQVIDPGRLLYVQHYEPIYRYSSNRERFELVISF